MQSLHAPWPLYYFAKALKICDTQLSVIFTVLQSGFGTYLPASLFNSFPRKLIESAIIDGCTKLQLLYKVVAPIMMPALMVLFTFSHSSGDTLHEI